jgi:mevalonate kinase
MVIASAPGKVYLIGEHAVVYGEPAIIAAICLRTKVACEKSDKVKYFDKRFDSEPNVWTVEEVKEGAKKVRHKWIECEKKKNFTELFSFVKANKYEFYRKSVVGIVLEMLDINDGVSVIIESDVPIGAGVGSSSSLSVALVKAIAKSYEKNISLDKVNEVAFELEKVIHGTPSGGDNAASCYGGLVWFVKGFPVKSLKKEIPQKLENFVLVYTKRPEKTTGELVQLVRDKEESFRKEKVSAIGKATHEMKDALKKKDMKKTHELMNLAQKNLAELGVSIPEIDRIAKAIRDIGGSAKLCGAGGGGVMLCHHDDKQLLVRTIKSLGYEPWETILGADGVRVEN